MYAGGFRRVAASQRYGAAEVGASAAEENQFEAGEARWQWVTGMSEPQTSGRRCSGTEGCP